METIVLKPPKIDPAVWRPDVPLVVIEKCLSDHHTSDGRKLDPAKLIVTWLAVRWLMAAYPGRRTHPTRQIAERVGAHMTSVTDWLIKLIDLGLIVKEAEIKPSRNLKKAGPQLEVTIDLIALEHQSRDIALQVLLRLGDSGGGGPPPNGAQLSLNFASDRISDQAPDRISDQSDLSDRISDQASDRISDQSEGLSDRISDQTPDRISDQHGGGGGVMEEESRARAKTQPVVRTPPDGWTLPAHPFDLWRAASDAPLPETHLLALASEHDGPTEGHGLYWVGRAILASSLKEKIKYVARVRQTLKTYTRRGYGADLYEEVPDETTASGGAPAGRREHPDRGAARAAAPARPVRPRAGQPGERIAPIQADLDQPL